MKLRLFHKFFFAFLAVGIAVVAVAGFLIERELRTDLTTLIDDEIAAEAGIIALMPAGEIARHAGELAQRAHARLTLIDAAGRVTTDSDFGSGEMDNHLDRPEIREARLKGVGKAVRYSLTLQKDMIYVAAPSMRERGRRDISVSRAPSRKSPWLPMGWGKPFSLSFWRSSVSP